MFKQQKTNSMQEAISNIEHKIMDLTNGISYLRTREEDLQIAQTLEALSKALKNLKGVYGNENED